MKDRTSIQPAATTIPKVWWRLAPGRTSRTRRWQRMAVAVLVVLLVLAPTGALAASTAHEVDRTPALYDDYRWIEINLSWQWLTAYEGDTPVLGVPVSTGIDGYDTPAGEFAIEWMLEWETMWGDDYYVEDVPYVMYFADYYAIHGAYWHDNFGEPMSHGCVNLPVWAAEWLYFWTDIGTPVWIHY